MRHDTTGQELRRRSQAFMNAGDPMVILDLDGRIIDLNDETERVYGWSREELLGKPLRFLVPVPQRETADELLRQCLAGEEVRNVEARRRSKSGAVYPALVTMSLLGDGEGRPLGVAALTRHVTKLKRDEKQLREGEQKYRSLVQAILDTAVEGIITIDEQGIVGSVNAAALEMFGYTADEVVGHNVAMLMAAPYEDEHDKYIANYLETGDRKVIGIGREAVAKRKDGSAFPIALSVSEVMWDETRIFTGFIRDITGLKRTERELREERDFAESLIETAQAIVLVLDPEGRIVRFNSFLEELSGFSLEEVKGKLWFDTFLPERHRSRVREIFGTAVSGSATRGNINPIVTKDGQERDITWWDKILLDAQGRRIGLLSVGHDVTELKRAQERAVQSERLAGIGEMITGLAHESRNALQRLQANLEMLAMEVEDRPEALAYVSRIQEAQNYLSQLYEEVRGYAAPLQLELKACDLRRLWRAAWADLELRWRGKDFKVVDRTGDVDVTCEVDPFAIGQVFRNIFENAISACGERGRIEMRCAESTLDGRPAIALTINDDGPGLPADARERIFQPFFTTKTQGTGLGMAIVRRIVEVHGGRIEVGDGALSGAALVVTLLRSSA